MKGKGAGNDDGLPKPRHARRVGAGLSLDKFASAGVSKFDKRKKIERLKKQQLIQHSKLGKLKKKLAAQGVLASGEVKDSIAELEALDGLGSGSGLDSGTGDQPSDEPRNEDPEREERVGSHAHAGAKPATVSGRHAHQTRDGAGTGDEVEGHGRGAHGQQYQQQMQGLIGNKRQRGDVEDGGEPKAGGGGGRGRGINGRGGAGRGGGRDGGRDGGRGRGRDGERLSQIQRLAQKVAQQKAEEQQAKEATRKEREERQKRLAAAEKARKEQKHLHFKRNAKGQPLMRFRMEKLLGQIEKGG
ncbi:hypothetical protein HYH02_006879 [Chlamydomonas schloesseri]|uniref:rRNA-processing protein FYV7 n=1 Tax=Chlamydomonas schloesseri TaxID=2026947 RepID=A0A836B5P3_9CHLO|nr:hypothetical protein HYH02_006879 [Chlamydomonas schloesseri]|eukprot:KAG2448295.1 hypothetical protein HYH02_006879 [Chlamydomonas schloesseri]